MTEIDGYKSGEIEAATASATIENFVISHPMLEDGLKRLRMHQARSFALAEGRPQRAHLLVITGEPGAGKTTLLEEHQRKFPPTLDDDGLRSPFVLVEMPFPCTRKGLVEAICGAMGHEPAEDWRTTRIVDEIARFIELHHVRMIAIDEADRIIGADTADVGRFLVSLLNRVKAQIVMAGAPEVANLHTGWGLGRRLQKGLVLDPYRWDSVEGQTMFRAMLDVFESKLGFSEKSGLKTFDMSQRLYVASSGHVGLVSKYLVEAALVTHLAGGDRLTLEILGETYAEFVRKDEEAKQTIDFDRDVLADPVEVQPAVAPADNPFLCPQPRLKKLWEAKREQRVKDEHDRRGDRKTGARGRAGTARTS